MVCEKCGSNELYTDIIDLAEDVGANVIVCHDCWHFWPDPNEPIIYREVKRDA